MPNSLIDFRDWSPTDLERLIDLSFKLEKENAPPSFKNKNAALIFLEPSTRTRMSFELAAYREGFNCSVLSAKVGSSLEKGETAEDTVLNISAMSPDVLIVRTADLDLREVAEKVPQPILNAGWGTHSHPTQALLDIRSLLAEGAKLSELKIVLIGDVKHSRVASSHFELSEKLGYKVAVCCPEDFRPSHEVKNFESLEEAMSWGNALMTLRFQLERHTENLANRNFAPYQVSLTKLKAWKKNGWLMHPGPVNYGVELDSDVKLYEKNLILKQVNSGFWIRRACLKKVLE